MIAVPLLAPVKQAAREMANGRVVAALAERGRRKSDSFSDGTPS
jgi:hypothetical protein